METYSCPIVFAFFVVFNRLLKIVFLGFYEEQYNFTSFLFRHEIALLFCIHLVTLPQEQLNRC